jgi:DNA repair exonuclease SbcCD ATPase subunit
MKIKSAAIRNYRLHKSRDVDFDQALTIISGPNESGKSTLVEALHRGLFLKSRTGGATREKMIPRDGSIPEITLSLELEGKNVTVRKVFQGSVKGLTVLDVEGEATVSGDTADDRLAQLLLVPNALGSNETALGQRWAHLWVWQGSSGGSPMEAVTEAKQSLVARLNAIGGAAVSQSELDDKVIRSLLAKRDKIYTQNGSDFRVTSEPGKAQQDMERAGAALDEHRKAVARLDAAMGESEAASSLLKEKTGTLQTATIELDQVKAKMRDVERIQKTIEPLEKALTDVGQELQSIQKATEEIVQDRQDLEKATGESQSHDAGLAEMRKKLAENSEKLEAATQERDSIRTELDGLKIHLDALSDQRLFLQKQAELKKLTERMERITALRNELHALQKQLESLPPIEKKDITALRKLQDELLQATSARDALGARIKYVKGDSPVMVADTELSLNDERLVTQDVDILVGETVLHVTLGGISNLREATDLLETATGKLNKKLQALGCATFDAAIEAHERQTVLHGNAKSLEKRLEEQNPEQVEADLAACRIARDRATARLASSMYEQFRLPTELETLEQEVDHTEKITQEAGTRYQTHVRLCKQMEEEKTKAETACGSISAQQQALRETTIRLTAGLDAKISLHGSDEERARKRLTLLTTQEQSGQSLTVLNAQLDALQPGLLESDLKRLEDTIQRAQATIHEARVRQQVAEQTLALDGNSDPRAALAAANAAFEATNNRFAQLNAQAEAIKYLAELGTGLQKEISKQINRPLEEKAKAYLETVFGPGVTVSLSEGIQTHETPSIEIDRPGIGRFSFSELSGGAHEQVGVALRLAMAEVLAEGYGGSLPIVLDDAFVNSDPDRVKALHRMLYLAAQHGLQVIVLTCNPSDYDTLGATEIRL